MFTLGMLAWVPFPKPCHDPDTPPRGLVGVNIVAAHQGGRSQGSGFRFGSQRFTKNHILKLVLLESMGAPCLVNARQHLPHEP